MKIFKIIFFIILFNNCYAIDVFVDETNNESQKIIYDKIIKSLSLNFSEINIFKESDIISYNKNQEYIFVIGKNLIPKIHSTINQDNHFILLGEYFVPDKFDLLSNWKMISLFPDPFSFSKKLNSMNFNLQKIYVVSDINKNSWFTEFLLKENNVEQISVANLQDAIKQYKEIISNIKKTDAILITPDSFFDKVLFSEILKFSWGEKFYTLSVLSSHVKKGILFSTSNNFDDNKFYYDYIYNFENKPKISGMLSDNSVGNERYAKHIDIIRNEIKEIFDLVY